VKITRQWLKDSTKYGAPTRAQLEVLGISWPPRAGWLHELVGTEISDEDAKKFIECKNIHKPPQTYSKTRVPRWAFCPHCGGKLP
jgi:hypothetical protein